jgi:transcription elongation factor Elf1
VNYVIICYKYNEKKVFVNNNGGNNMSSNKTIKWIEAGKVFSRDPKGEFQCPECEQNTLQSEDKYNHENPKELQRTIFCQSCGARYTLRLRRYDK